MPTGVEGVVLYIGGGEASHSAELMRMSNFFHFRGQEGWLTATAGEARELATPGTGVTVMPGPFLVNSRFPGGALQAYMGRIMTAVDVPTTNVPPGDPRSDLVVLNIEDPYPSDGTFWPFPGAEGSQSRREGPYARLRVIDNVPTNTLTIDDLPTNRPERSWTCIAIARLDRPQNTGTITSSMIKNLRPIINPWAGIQLPQEILDRLSELEDALSDLGDTVEGENPQKFPVPALYTNGGIISNQSLAANTVYVSDLAWKNWPPDFVSSNIIIPPWATYMTIDVDIISVLVQTGSSNAGVDANVYVGLRYSIGNAVSTPSYQEVIEPNDVYYAPCPDKRATRPPQLTNLKLGARLYIDKRDIGKRVTGALQVQMANVSNGRLHNGILRVIPGISSMSGIVNFKERPG